MISIKSYSPEYFDIWNSFVETSANGSLFDRLDFLAYHQGRFQANEHHLLWLKGDAVFAVMPLAIFEEDGRKVGKSPYGGSFGGVIYRTIDAGYADLLIKTLLEYGRQLGLDRLHITLSPLNYSRVQAQYLQFFLLSNGFVYRQSDLFSVVPLAADYPAAWNGYQGRTRTSIRRAVDQFDIDEDVSPADFYPILLEDKRRHDNAPVTHSLDDLAYLKTAFPGLVRFDIATHRKSGGKAGICYFQPSPTTILTFYISQETSILKENGPSVLIDRGIKRAIEKGLRYFDFGASSIGYHIQNPGVAKFKEGFGAIGLTRESFAFEFANH